MVWDNQYMFQRGCIKTIQQVSCGGLIYREHDGRVEVAVIASNPERYWQIPKGGCERGESFEETAVREVYEETGLFGKIVAPLDTVTYWYQRTHRNGQRIRFHKTVHFYLLKYISGDMKNHDWEVLEVRWLSFDEAEALLDFKNAKQILRKARRLLNQSNQTMIPL